MYTRKQDLYHQLLDSKIKDIQKDIKHTKESLDEKITSSCKDLEIHYKYLKDRGNAVDRWLSVIGIIVAIFGVAIPIVGFFTYTNQKDEFERYLEEAREYGKRLEKDLGKVLIPSNFNANLPEGDAAEKSRKEILEIISAKPQKDLTKQEYNFLARKAYEKKEFYESITNFSKVIAIDTNDAKAYNNRGLAKAKLGEYGEAIKDYNKAIAINPNFAQAYYNRGNAKDTLGDQEGAKQDLEKAKALRKKRTKESK